MKKTANLLANGAAIAVAIAIAVPAAAESDSGADAATMATGLVIPPMDAAAGRELFAARGCVVCHSINGVGGIDAPPLDAEFMFLPMNPFDFAARMWGGAEAMVELQREELGDVIYLNGDELAAIIAFVHDADEQALFSEADIPEDIAELMAHAEEEDDEDHDDEDGDDEGDDDHD